MKKFDFTFEPEKENRVNRLLQLGASEILEGQLWLCGEPEVAPVLPKVDIWVDLRHDGEFNQTIYIPPHVCYVRLPIRDGDAERAEVVFPVAKDIVSSALNAGKRVVVSCHAGLSRSALVVWWVLSEWLENAEEAWLELTRKRPGVSLNERFYPFVRSNILLEAGKTLCEER